MYKATFAREQYIVVLNFQLYILIHANFNRNLDHAPVRKKKQSCSGQH